MNRSDIVRQSKLSTTYQQHNADLGSPNRSASTVEPSAPSGDQSINQDLVNKYAALLFYYQSKYPVEKSVLLLEAEKIYTRLSEPISGNISYEQFISIVTGYDERLQHSEGLVKSLQNAMSELEVKLEKVIKENEDLRKYSTLSHESSKRIEILLEENALLLEEQKRCEPLIAKTFELEEEVARLKATSQVYDSDEYQKLKQETASQAQEIYVLKSRLSDAESQRQKIESDLKEKEQTVMKKMEEFLTMKEKAEKIQRYCNGTKSRVEDWEQCCMELGINEWLPEYAEPSAKGEIVDGILLRALRALKQQMLELKRKYKNVTDDHKELSKSHVELIHRYQIDLEKSETSIRSLRSHLDTFAQNTQLIKQERDAAITEAKEQAREVAVLHERIRRIIKESDLDHEQRIQKQREQVASLQDQWSLEREALQREIYALKKGKVDLQVELGWVLRDKRSNEVELSHALKNLDIQRDKYKRELLSGN